jgi:predicted nucleic acid-binding protein
VTLVVDASTVTALLVDQGPDGTWAERILRDEQLVAPHLLPVEVASILRRAVRARQLSQDSAALAHRDLLSLAVAYFPYEPFADRVWALRANVTAYDAWYVAIAEALGAPLATLDLKLSRAGGPRCRFVTPG